MDSDKLWHWLWYGGGGLVWLVIIGIVGYFRHPAFVPASRVDLMRDRIDELERLTDILKADLSEAKAESRREIDELKRRHERCEQQNAELRAENISLMKMLLTDYRKGTPPA